MVLFILQTNKKTKEDRETRLEEKIKRRVGIHKKGRKKERRRNQ